MNAQLPHRSFPNRLVVVGTSAGGVESLCQVVSAIPANLGGAIVIAMHLSPRYPSKLPSILGLASRLPVRFASDREQLLDGHVYVAPPAHDVFVSGENIRLRACSLDQRFRPSIDTLFQSAAYEFAAQSVGVVLSGALNDGAFGIRSIQRAGGTTVVQTPEEAMFDGMPRSAIDTTPIDHVLPAHKIGQLLVRLMPAGEPVRTALSVNRTAAESAVKDPEGPILNLVLEDPFFQRYTCCECSAGLKNLQDLRRMYDTQAPDPAGAKLQALESGVMVLQHLVRHLSASGLTQLVQGLQTEARDLEKQGNMLRNQIALARRAE